MKPGPRAAIAYFAGVLVSGHSGTTIFDSSQKREIKYAGTVAPGQVRVFDFAHHCYITGTGDETQLKLLHLGENSYITLKLQEHQFSGKDCGSGSYFNGSVSGKWITIYDHQERQYFHYSF